MATRKQDIEKRQEAALRRTEMVKSFALNLLKKGRDVGKVVFVTGLPYHCLIIL